MFDVLGTNWTMLVNSVGQNTLTVRKEFAEKTTKRIWLTLAMKPEA